MNSRVFWSVEGIEPSVRERAEAAARRAGMSLGDWLNSQIGDATPNFGSRQEIVRELQRNLPPNKDAQEVAEIHQRLDSIARQIETISQPASRNEPGVARQLNDAISRLDARLSQITEPMPGRQFSVRDQQRLTETVERAAGQVPRASPLAAASSLDFAIAEIAARQSELDGTIPRTLPPRSAPPVAPVAPPAPDFLGLEKHLLKITSQIEALQRPSGIEESIATFRSELTEIRKTITEAMPRQAIESIENEIRTLSRRIDDSRQYGIDAQALAGVERALAEIRDALRSLTPAEQLAGFDEAIRNLGGKIDAIVRSSDDPGTLLQLEGAISALRSIVSNVASNDALVRLNDDVQMLASKVDQLGRLGNHSDSFAALEHRIAALTSSLEAREHPAMAGTTGHLEGALQALSDRLDHLPVGNDSSSAFAHLEQRVSYLLERLEASSDHRSGNLGRVEEGLQEILLHLERQHENFASMADTGRVSIAPTDTGLADVIKRELTDMRFSQSETDRHTQDALEVVHNTLGHVVDRLAMIEGDLRVARSAPVVPQAAMPHGAALAMSSQPAPPAIRPELPNPAAAQTQSAAAHRNFQTSETVTSAVPATSNAISDIFPQPSLELASAVVADQRQPRAAIDPSLPPDYPLEPGTRSQGRAASPSERIASSEQVISEISSGSREQVSTSNFIAAARRAAQAAAAASSNEKTTRSTAVNENDAGKGPSTIKSKIRSLLVGASVVVIVLGSFKMAMTLLDGNNPPPAPAAEKSGEASPVTQQPAGSPAAKPAKTEPALPSLTSPTPIDRQSINVPAPTRELTPADGGEKASADTDTTGTIPATQPSLYLSPAAIPIPASERLPEAIGGPALRTAALKGDPAAAYEIGVRYAEGRGVTANFAEAAKWYDRAAQGGVVPGMFRLGTLYEKGISVKKDLDAARRYYTLAADRGNAKAMHNLAVLDADGGSKGANYKSASQWFRKAAERGVADSQFNLGILYARGIGVEQNLAESFKWFSLAAAQGDTDAGRKRDDLAKRLDPQSLAAAKLAIQTFAPESQPDDAINVASPAGGWDNTSAKAPTAKPVATKRAAAR